jgi:hypothetical protein
MMSPQDLAWWRQEDLLVWVVEGSCQITAWTARHAASRAALEPCKQGNNRQVEPCTQGV